MVLFQMRKGRGGVSSMMTFEQGLEGDVKVKYCVYVIE